MTLRRIRPLVAVATVIVMTACSDGGNGRQPGAGGGGDPDAVHIKTGCDRFFYGGTEPQIVKATLARDLKRLCYRSFAIAYSPVSRTAMWSAEVVDGTTVRLARRLERRDEFHPESRLAPPPGTPKKDSPRAELADYRGSGYDRGHLAPSGDMPTRDSQAESFSLANIVPQAPKLNRGSWSELESDIRDQSLDVKRIYVLTGPVFNGRNIPVVNGRVMIPSHLWKAILIPSKGATVYVASNTDYPVWKTMSVLQFAQFSGINPFPGIPEAMAKANMAIGQTVGQDGKSTSGSGSAASGVTNDPWNPNGCNAPWRPTNDPHYGDCHPIGDDEAKYGLVPGTMGNSRSTTWNSSTSAAGGGSAAAPAGGARTKGASGPDPATRLRDRNRDRNRDREARGTGETR